MWNRLNPKPQYSNPKQISNYNDSNSKRFPLSGSRLRKACGFRVSAQLLAWKVYPPWEGGQFDRKKTKVLKITNLRHLLILKLGQINHKFQYSTTETGLDHWSLEFGSYLIFVIWCLEFCQFKKATTLRNSIFTDLQLPSLPDTACFRYAGIARAPPCKTALFG